MIAQQPEFFGNFQVGFYSAYFTDVTPITIVDLDGNRKFTHQYTATHQNMLIGGEQSQIIIRYEMSSIQVVYSFEDQSLLKFIVNLCAVIGGLFTVVSIIEALLSNIVGTNKQPEIKSN